MLPFLLDQIQLPHRRRPPSHVPPPSCSSLPRTGSSRHDANAAGCHGPSNQQQPQRPDSSAPTSRSATVPSRARGRRAGWRPHKMGYCDRGEPPRKLQKWRWRAMPGEKLLTNARRYC